MSLALSRGLTALVSRLGFRLVIAAATTAVIAATFAAMLALQFSELDELATADRATRMRAASQALTSAMDQAGRFALAQAETIARRTAVQKALAANDRAALTALSTGTWDYLRDQTGVTIFGYHSADMRYLLRVHKPESFGDDISVQRPMVLAANKTRRAQVGLEIGVSGIVGVRGVTVVRDGDTFAGTMEVGLDLQPILDRVKTVTNTDLAVVLSRSLAGLDGKGAGGDLTIAASTDQSRFTELLRSGAVRIARETEVRSIPLDGVGGALLVQPLVDFSSRLVGDLVLVASFPEQATQARRMRTDLVTAATVGGILAFVLFSVLAFGVARRPEDAK